MVNHATKKKTTFCVFVKYWRAVSLQDSGSKQDEMDYSELTDMQPISGKWTPPGPVRFLWLKRYFVQELMELKGE